MNKSDDRFPDILDRYETGVWIILIIVAASIFGLVLWLGYMVLL
jgi:hypothetical protein